MIQFVRSRRHQDWFGSLRYVPTAALELVKKHKKPTVIYRPSPDDENYDKGVWNLAVGLPSETAEQLKADLTAAGFECEIIENPYSQTPQTIQLARYSKDLNRIDAIRSVPNAALSIVQKYQPDFTEDASARDGLLSNFTEIDLPTAEKLQAELLAAGYECQIVDNLPENFYAATVQREPD